MLFYFFHLPSKGCAKRNNSLSAEDMDYFMLVTNVNGDDAANILDYQALYEMVKQ